MNFVNKGVMIFNKKIIQLTFFQFSVIIISVNEKEIINAMFIKDEQYYLDLEKAHLARTLSDPEEDEAYSRIVEKGEIK